MHRRRPTGLVGLRRQAAFPKFTNQFFESLTAVTRLDRVNDWRKRSRHWLGNIGVTRAKQRRTANNQSDRTAGVADCCACASKVDGLLAMLQSVTPWVACAVWETCQTGRMAGLCEGKDLSRPFASWLHVATVLRTVSDSSGYTAAWRWLHTNSPFLRQQRAQQAPMDAIG